MIRMFVRHPVADFTAWKQVYDDFGDERDRMGAVAHAVYQSASDPNDVTVWHDFATLDEARAFAESDRLRETMQSAGVAGEPEIWFTSEA